MRSELQAESLQRHPPAPPPRARQHPRVDAPARQRGAGDLLRAQAAHPRRGREPARRLVPLYRELLARPRAARLRAAHRRADPAGADLGVAAARPPARAAYCQPHRGAVVFHGAQTVISYWQTVRLSWSPARIPPTTRTARRSGSTACPRASSNAPRSSSAPPASRSTSAATSAATCAPASCPRCSSSRAGGCSRGARRRVRRASSGASARPCPAGSSPNGVHLDLRPPRDRGSAPHTIAQLTLERMRRRRAGAKAEPHSPGPRRCTRARPGSPPSSARSAERQRAARAHAHRWPQHGHRHRRQRPASRPRRWPGSSTRLARIDLSVRSCTAVVTTLVGAAGDDPRARREGFHTPLRALLQGRAEPLELVISPASPTCSAPSPASARRW